MDNSNTISQEHKEEMPKISMSREGMQNFMCNWLDSLKERECVTSAACKADGNISKGNFYKTFFCNSDKKSNSVVLTDYQITREPFGNLDMTIQNQPIVDCGISLREKVNNPNDHDIIKEYDEKGKNVEKNVYLKSGNANSLSEIEENTKGNKETSHANWKAVLELDDDKITCIMGNKNDSCEHIKPSTSVPVNIITKLYKNNPVCFVEESTQKLNFRYEVQGDSQENGKNKETLSGPKDVSGGQEEKQERGANDGGENLNLEACDKTPAECCQSVRNQCDNLPVDMTLGDNTCAVDSEISRHSPSTSDHIFQSTLEDLFCSSGVEERKEHWIINPELAAQQFREVMGLTDDEPSEEYQDGTPCDLQLKS
ncbi:uncharacterized protein [Panulirus ornatus]|uniref:uncharacterized protein n=1 Tax=Panulirus ornatus TaxID=150431 RepID=UPI003A8BD463